MTAIDNSKAKNRCTIYRERSAFFRRRKCKISFVRRAAFVLALKHPSGTKFVNFPQVQRFLDKSHRFVDLLLQSFQFTGYDNVALELSPCFSVFTFQIFKRFFDCLALNVDVETDGSHSALGVLVQLASTLSAIAPYYSPLSFQSNPG